MRKIFSRLGSAVSRILPRAPFVRSVAVLAGGTAVAQVIAVLMLPMVTRLYTPADFSVLAVYSSILAMVSVTACLRLDIAIPLPESDEDAANLLAVALACCTCVAFLAALAVWLLASPIIAAVGQPGLSPYLWLIPLGIWMTSAYSAIQFWATRKQRFPAIAKTRLAQTLGSAIAQLGLGLWGGFAAFGLLLGQLISSGAGVFGLGWTACQADQKALRSINGANMRRVFHEHNRFPKYSTIEAVANSGAIEIPVIIIAATVLGPEAGYLFLAMKAMAMPISLIGGSVSQVFLSRAPEELRAGQLGPFTLRVIGGLVQTGVGPLAFAGVVAPLLFPLVFGQQWQRAGEMITWMTPWFIMQFLSSPVSMSLHITNNQHLAMVLQFFGLAVRVGATGIAALHFKDFIFEFYAVSGLVFYAIYLLVVFKVTRIRLSDFWKEIVDRLNVVLMWSVSAATVLGVVSLLKIGGV